MNTRLFLKSIFIVCLSIFLCSNVSGQPSEWIPRGIGGGGALFSPSISPHNSDEVFIACDMIDDGRRDEVYEILKIKKKVKDGD